MNVIRTLRFSKGALKSDKNYQNRNFSFIFD